MELAASARHAAMSIEPGSGYGELLDVMSKDKLEASDWAGQVFFVSGWAPLEKWGIWSVGDESSFIKRRDQIFWWCLISAYNNQDQQPVDTDVSVHLSDPQLSQTKFEFTQITLPRIDIVWGKRCNVLQADVQHTGCNQLRCQ